MTATRDMCRSRSHGSGAPADSRPRGRLWRGAQVGDGVYRTGNASAIVFPSNVPYIHCVPEALLSGSCRFVLNVMIVLNLLSSFVRLRFSF
jgi:hypothetical protein